MEFARELILAFKQNNKSCVGYGYQKECEALVSHVLQNMVKSQLPPLKADKKNDQDSIKCREEGNQHFVSRDDSKAIEYYTKSLAYASTEEMMAYARANRSAALYRKKMYVNCIIDVNAALSLGYSQDKAAKIKERREKALSHIRQLLQTGETDNALLEAAKTLNLHSSEDEKPISDPFADSIKSSKSGKYNMPSVEDVTKSTETEKKEDIGFASISSVSSIPLEHMYLVDEEKPLVTHGPSEEAPAASSGIRIASSKKYGRHLVATKTFRPGDIICAEDPFADIIYKQRYYTHCHHCLTKSYNMIPCSRCPIAVYCSEKCRGSAWKIAHCTECPILVLLSNLLNVDDDKIKILTKIIRFLIELTANGSTIDKLREDIKVSEQNPDARTAGFTDDGIFDSSSFRTALSLTTNLETRPLADISAFACIASLTVILLATQTNFFGKKYPVNQMQNIGENADIRFCGSLMFRGCVIMSSNSFSIQIEPGVKCGSGLYVLHSLFNHNCAPNTMRHFEGVTMITRALIPISPGDQVFTSYYGGYQYSLRSERRKKIKEDYFFDCDCIACATNWPTFSEIMNKHIGSISNNKKLQEKMAPIKARLRNNKYDIEAIKCALELLCRETKMPCEEMAVAMQYLKSYYLGKFK